MRREAELAYAGKHSSSVGRAFEIGDAAAALYWTQQVRRIGYRARITSDHQAYDEVVEISFPQRTAPVFRVHRGLRSVVVTCPFGRMSFATLTQALLSIVPLSHDQEARMAGIAARASRQDCGAFGGSSLLGRIGRALQRRRWHVGLASPG